MKNWKGFVESIENKEYWYYNGKDCKAKIICFTMKQRILASEFEKMNSDWSVMYETEFKTGWS